MINSTTAKDLIVSALQDYGAAILIILTAIVTLAVGYLTFKFGWHKVKTATGSEDHDPWSDANISSTQSSVKFMRTKGSI